MASMWTQALLRIPVIMFSYALGRTLKYYIILKETPKKYIYNVKEVDKHIIIMVSYV